MAPDRISAAEAEYWSVITTILPSRNEPPFSVLYSCFGERRPIVLTTGVPLGRNSPASYTPSGRCIQKHYDKGHGEEYLLELYNRFDSGELWSADSIQRPDSLKYHTLKNNRPVYGGGGIIPDYDAF